MYDKEVDRKRRTRIKKARSIKKELISLGAEETNNELVVCFRTSKYIRPRGNMWTYKGKVYIRWSNLGPKDVQRIKDLLDLEKIPAKAPLRRKAIKGLVRDQMTVEEFYATVK